MKKLAVLLIAMVSLLSGCVVYDDHHRDGRHYRGDQDGSWSRDRDRDGVPDRQDRRPYDPYRY